jgi:hypothetical protein
MPPRGTYIGFQASKEEQVLAVRFAVQKNLPYLTFGWQAKQRTRYYSAMEVQSISGSFKSNFHLFLDYMRGGLFLILALLHLALFWFNPCQKATLYFFLYSILAALLSFCFPGIHPHLSRLNQAA